MRQTESSQQGPKGDGEGMRNSHYDTKHPVGAGRGTVDSATRLKAGQYRDQGLAGDGTHCGHSHATDLRLHGMGNGGRESTPGGITIVWR